LPSATAAGNAQKKAKLVVTGYGDTMTDEENILERKITFSPAVRHHVQQGNMGDVQWCCK
jgi:hypothetical protein